MSSIGCVPIAMPGPGAWASVLSWVCHGQTAIGPPATARPGGQPGEKTQAAVMAGSVLVDERQAVKPASLVDEGASLQLVAGAPYASRGGEKLGHALDIFEIDVAGALAADIGGVHRRAHGLPPPARRLPGLRHRRGTGPVGPAPAPGSASSGDGGCQDSLSRGASGAG